MKLKTATGALAAVLLLAAGYQVAATVTRNQNTTADMPKPKHAAPNADGRVYAVVQLCWLPSTAKGAPHIVLGPLDRGETNVSIPGCDRPWTRKGLVRPGDRVAVAWVMNAETPARVVRWRISINNTMRMENMRDTRQHALNGCIVGTPPC